MRFDPAVKWLFFPIQAFVLGFLLNLVGVKLTGLPRDLVSAIASVNSPLMFLMGISVFLYPRDMMPTPNILFIVSDQHNAKVLGHFLNLR